jgi:CxxC-x17-CxxC domain-containing protein
MRYSFKCSVCNRRDSVPFTPRSEFGLKCRECYNGGWQPSPKDSLGFYSRRPKAIAPLPKIGLRFPTQNYRDGV